MPTTASPQVSSTVGLKNVVIAPLTEDTEAALTYGTLQLLAGAMEASITPENADPDIQYADDIEFDVLYPDPELSFKTKMADIPLQIQEMIFGNQIDDNGVLVRTASDKPPYFAVGFEWCFDGEPIGGTVAVSSVGTQKAPAARKLFLDGYSEMMARLQPEKIIFFGDVPEGCTGNIERHTSFHSGLAHARKLR